MGKRGSWLVQRVMAQYRLTWLCMVVLLLDQPSGPRTGQSAAGVATNPMT